MSSWHLRRLKGKECRGKEIKRVVKKLRELRKEINNKLKNILIPTTTYALVRSQKLNRFKTEHFPVYGDVAEVLLPFMRDVGSHYTYHCQVCAYLRFTLSPFLFAISISLCSPSYFLRFFCCASLFLPSSHLSKFHQPHSHPFIYFLLSLPLSPQKKKISPCTVM